MVSLLTSTRNSKLDSAWMPSSNASNFTKTLVSFPWKLLGMPSASDTLESVTLSDTNNINHFILSEVGLVSNRSSVELNFHDVSLLLSTSENLHLGMNNDTDGGAILLHLIEIFLDLLLSKIISPFCARLGKSLLLGLRPIFVKSPLAFLSNVLGPNGLKSTHASWSLDVSDNSHSHHWWSFNKSHGFNNLFLVDFGAWSVHFSYDVGHSSLVSHETSHVDWLRRIILGEGLGLTLVPLRPLLGKKSLRTMTRRFELPMRHCVSCRSESSNISLV